MHAAITTHRRGISLLEVLISMGILSIGLLASLALIPAGRTYMKKAAVDDRAAALVPNAYATMKILGIFSERSLVWSGHTDAPLLYPEPYPVIREQAGTDVFTTPSSTGSTLDGGWTIETIDDEQITSFHPQNLPPTTITGSVPPIPAASGTTPRAASYVVTVTCSTTWQVSGTTKTGTSNPYDGPNGTTTANPDTGRWTFSITTSNTSPLNAPDMTIFTSGSNVGQPSNNSGPNNTGSNSNVLYTFGATYVDTTGTTTPPPVLNANPSLTTFRQYGRLRATDHRFGKAKTTYTKPSNAADGNHLPSSAMDISLTPLENAVSQKTGQLASFVEKTVKGTLWRMQIGTRRGRYDQDVDFDNADGAPPRPRPPIFPNDDITRNVGDTWLDGSGNPQAGPDDTPEDIDWYKFDVEAGNVLEITWHDDPLGDVLLTDRDAINRSYKFPMYFKENAIPMQALNRSGNIDTYTIPQDGYVKTRAQLLPSWGSDYDLNTFGSAGVIRDRRRNPHYDFKIKLSRSDRVVVVDPLLATRLDKIIALNGGAGRFDPYYLRRHRFADFQQFFTGSGSPRAFIIPRLNWQPYGSANVDVRLAMADKLFRDQDNIAIDQPTNEDDAPTPLFDLSSLASPVRRQAEGRMSWLLMLQPEDPGSVQSNWHAGRYFNVSMVIFEDRKLPAPVSGAALDGEYALFGNWSELDGQITVNVPTSGPNATATADLDEEDVRQLFKAGAYVLVAPRTINEGSLFDGTQQLDWVRIQTSQIQRNLDGNGFLVTLLPDHEPKVLNGSASNALVVAAYQGVVSVVSKSMRLDE